MAKMSVESVRVALAKDGMVTVAEAEDMAVGQVMRDPESKKWVARVIAEDGKVGRAKTDTPAARRRSARCCRRAAS